MKSSMFKILNNNRGMALLMTILIISLILVMTLRFNMSMRSSLTSAANLQDDIALDNMAKSVFNSARAILSVDAAESSFDTLHEDWANLEATSQFFAYFFSRGQGGMDIIDHSGRLQINSLMQNKEGAWIINEEQKKVWTTLLSAEEFELGEDEALNIIEAIIDWLDEDDEPLGFGGAESSYYQDLDTPYEPRNGPMEFIEELLLVKGVTNELYLGTGEVPGLASLVTPHGRDGKININTAHAFVLGSLSEQIDQDMVDGMVTFRDDEENDLGDPEWYKWAPGFPGDITIQPGLIATSSSFFEIMAEVVSGNMRKKVRGMVLRGSESSSGLVYWKIE
jgi:general secretion pathway protein K